MLPDYPHFDTLTLADQLRLTGLEDEDRLPLAMLDAIQRGAGPAGGGRVGGPVSIQPLLP